MSASGRQNRNGLWKLVWQTSKLIQIFIYHGIYKLPFGLSWFCLDYISGTNAGSFEIYFVMNDIILSRCWASLSCLIICTSRWVVYYAIFCQCWDLTPRWLACCCIFVFTLKILFWLSAEKKRISSIKTWKLTATEAAAECELRSGGADKSVFLHDARLSARCLIRVKSQFLINDIQTVLCKVLWGLSTFWSVASNWSVTAESAQLWPINISLGQKNHLISSRASPQLRASLDTVDI